MEGRFIHDLLDSWKGLYNELRNEGKRAGPVLNTIWPSGSSVCVCGGVGNEC